MHNKKYFVLPTYYKQDSSRSLRPLGKNVLRRCCQINFFELQFNGPLLTLKVSSVVIGLKVSVFTINWQTWQFLFSHGSLPKVLLRIGSEALTKWSFKLFPLQNPTIKKLGNTFWCSLSGTSRICNSSKIILKF